ncbi:hypothetical protein O6H91_18G060600 [Diphasiastrum complanatum]|uniref:Uncharacterized protein n=2 Tax=Diphasiastrum complanatum TaxID=34168 RepID=A0ACC2B1W7_DIPCM|nr:hypothetical protein O6H91_18G060600 [Diphasiastrum complanatum]KAJ7523732.1 hypothetical protein O6H91_18G060600 [Diphasiastrum complanatum]
MATLLMQTPDVVSTEKYVFSPVGHSHFQAEVVSGISQDQAVQQKAAQAGRSRPRKGKNGQKRLPQRGLGVAQLEKLRLQEQTRQESACLTSLHAATLPFSSFGEQGSTFCLPYSFGHQYKGGTLQDKGLHSDISAILTHEHLKAAHSGDQKSVFISNSVSEITQRMFIDCQALDPRSFYSDPLICDKNPVVSSLPTVLTQQEKGDSEASCVSRVQDSSNMNLNISVSNHLTVSNEKIMHKDLRQQGANEVSASSLSQDVNPKSSSDSVLDNRFSNQIRFMENFMWEHAETGQRIVLKPRSTHPEYRSASLHDISYTSSSNSKHEADGVKDDGSGNKCGVKDDGSGNQCGLSSTLTNVELFDATLGPPGVLQPQPSHTDISSVIISSFGERPKELSSFQNYLGTQVWSSIDKAFVKKRKWPEMQDTSNLLHSADLGYDAKVFEPELKFLENTISRAYSISDHNTGVLCNSGIERKFLSNARSPLTEADLAKLIPVVPKNQNLLSLANKWPERSIYSGDLSSFKGYVAQPVIYNAVVGKTSFDHKKKACTLVELLPMEVGHQLPTDALSLQLSSPSCSTYAKLETKETLAEKAHSPSSEIRNLSHIQPSDGDCVIKSKQYIPAQVEKVYHVFPKIERSDVEASSEQHLPLVGYWMFLATDHSVLPPDKGSTNQETGCNVDANSTLDLSLKLAL